MTIKQINAHLLSKKQWYEIAKIIDNEFTGSLKSFSTYKHIGYYFLTTNKCDGCSLVKCYYDEDGCIVNIVRIGSDTDSYKKIHKNTLQRINKYLQQ